MYFVLFPADSIEANVENTDTNIQKGMHQLARAADHQVMWQRYLNIWYDRSGEEQEYEKTDEL